MNKRPENIELQDHSFRIESEADLMAAFGEKDQKKVLPPQGVSYPIEARHYYAWREPSGVYVYMIFRKPNWKTPIGVVFKRPSGGSHLSNARLCDWCLSYGASDLVGMLSVTLNQRTSIGMMLCLDLKCAERLEEVSELSGKSFEKLMNQLYERIERFYDGVLRAKSVPNIDDADSENVH